MDRAQSTRLEELIADAVDERLYRLRVALPAKVISYDAATQFASVQPLIMHAFRDETGVRQVESLPIINDVPVLMFGGGGGEARLTFPIAIGDVVLLVFCSSSIARWLVRAGAAEVDPADDRRHDINDAIAIGGLHNYKTSPTDAPTDALVLHVSGGKTIKLGSSGASKGVARAGDPLSFDWTRIQTILDSRYTGSGPTLATTADATPGDDGTVKSGSGTVKADD